MPFKWIIYLLQSSNNLWGSLPSFQKGELGLRGVKLTQRESHSNETAEPDPRAGRLTSEYTLLCNLFPLCLFPCCNHLFMPMHVYLQILSFSKLFILYWSSTEGNGTPLQHSCLENPVDGGAWWAAVHGVAKSRTRLSDFIFTFHFHALEKEMATHSSVFAWRIPGMAEPSGLPSMGSHRVGHDWSDLTAAAVCTCSS